MANLTLRFRKYQLNREEGRWLILDIRTGKCMNMLRQWVFYHRDLTFRRYITQKGCVNAIKCMSQHRDMTGAIPCRVSQLPPKELCEVMAT